MSQSAARAARRRTPKTVEAERVPPTLEERLQQEIDAHNAVVQAIDALQAQIAQAEVQRQQIVGKIKLLEELRADAPVELAAVPAADEGAETAES